MYKVCIYNNGTETTIHYPTADQEAPHLNKLPLKEGLSQIDSLSFSIKTNNLGYNSLFELTTKIKVIDIRDGSIRFAGRILDSPEKMDAGGNFYKDVLCEGALSYLNDTKTRADTFLGAPAEFIQWILNIHNGKVEDAKKIQAGNIDVIGSIAYTCSFKTALETILEVKEKFSINGDIRVRETNGILYLDWLQSFSNNTIDVTLGINMKDMVKDKDVTSLGTRIIPLGANNLTISDANGGLDYIEDANAKNVYGVIEKTVSYSDITDATELKNKCIEDSHNYTQPSYVLESTALDLSFISGNKAEQFVLGVNLHIFNHVMNVDDIYKVVALDLDLLQPYNPKLTIANAPVKLTSTINDLRKTTLSNNGVYNGVQVGDSFGVRIVRSDKKVVTTLNATEGISVENDTKKVFSTDTSGNIVANDGTYNNITANNTTANEGNYNNITAEGGTFNNITAQGGTFNNITANNIVVEKGTITGATLQTSKPGSGRERVAIVNDEFNSYDSSGKLTFKIDGSRINVYDSGNYVGSIYGSGNYLQIDLPSDRQFLISEGGFNKLVYWNEEFDFLCNVNVSSSLTQGGSSVATKSWVMQYVADNMPSSEPTS